MGEPMNDRQIFWIPNQVLAFYRASTKTPLPGIMLELRGDEFRMVGAKTDTEPRETMLLDLNNQRWRNKASLDRQWGALMFAIGNNELARCRVEIPDHYYAVGAWLCSVETCARSNPEDAASCYWCGTPKNRGWANAWR